MIISLPTQPYNILPKPAYVVIERYVPNRFAECIINLDSICHKEKSESGDFGGHFIIVSGTTSGNVYQTQDFITWQYPIPSLLVYFDYRAHLLEIRPEVRSFYGSTNT